MPTISALWFAPRGVTPDYSLDRSQRRSMIARISVGAGGFILFAFLPVYLLVIPLAGDWLLTQTGGNPERYATGLILLTVVTTAAGAGAGTWWWLRRQAVLRVYDRQRPPPASAALSGVRPETKTAPKPSTSTTPPDTKDSTS